MRAKPSARSRGLAGGDGGPGGGRRRCSAASASASASASAVTAASARGRRAAILHTAAAIQLARAGGGARAADAADLYFPPELLGSWQIESRDAESNGRAEKPPVFYEARFVGAPGRPAGGGAAVLDRGFTTSTLLEAEVGPGSVEQLRFDVRRPDYLFFRLRGGLGAESRVLRRRQFYGAAPGELHTVELMLQTVDNTRDVDGPPSRTLSQNETVYDLGGGPGRTFRARQVISIFAVPQELGGRPQRAPGGAGGSLLGQVEVRPRVPGGRRRTRARAAATSAPLTRRRDCTHRRRRHGGAQGLLAQKPSSVYRFDLTFTKADGES